MRFPSGQARRMDKEKRRRSRKLPLKIYSDENIVNVLIYFLSGTFTEYFAYISSKSVPT